MILELSGFILLTAGSVIGDTWTTWIGVEQEEIPESNPVARTIIETPYGYYTLACIKLFLVLYLFPLWFISIPLGILSLWVTYHNYQVIIRRRIYVVHAGDSI